MDARRADIAFVLEEAPGVSAAYLIRAGTKASAYFDFAVQLEGAGAAAAATYALLRVLTYEDIARVYFFVSHPASIIAEASDALVLDGRDRELARARVKPPEKGWLTPGGKTSSMPVASWKPWGKPFLVLYGTEKTTQEAVAESGIEHEVATSIADIEKACSQHVVSAVLVDESIAFGRDGVLARLPLKLSLHCFVVLSPTRHLEARWRMLLQTRVLQKPLTAERLRVWLGVYPEATAPTAPSASKKLAAPLPKPDDSFRALLVKPPTDLYPTLQKIVRHDSRIIVVPDVVSGVNQIFAAPFHFIACGVDAALAPKSFIDAVAQQDRAAAERIVVVAPDADVAYTRWKLGRMNANNVVVPSPVDEVWLGHRIFGANPALAESLAVKDLDPDPLAPPQSHAFRRKTMLLVDDDPSTAILFAARTPTTDAYDLVYAENAMQAFEVVTSRPIDALLVSAKMRNEGNEPFYRVLWRLHPALKASTLLLVDGGAAGPLSASGRIVERPLRRDMLQTITNRL